MRKIFCECVILTIIIFSIAGCHMIQKLYLEPPQKVPPQELQDLQHPATSNEFMVDSVKEMAERLEVRFSAKNIYQDTSPILQDCLTFLVKEFGTPVYQGRVLLIITDDPSDNAYITWRENDDLDRQITLNHYNIMKPMWHHYLVHELFHAFYQSRDFLKVNPDSIIEGLAIYAQYKYQNREISNDQIREKIYEDAAALRTNSNRMGIDFDRPFQSYGERERKYLYLVSGLLFFNQDPEQINATIKKLLGSSSNSGEKMQFDSIVARYNLAPDDVINHRNAKMTLALPAPTKIEFDPFQDTAATTKPDKGERIEYDALDMEIFRPISGISER